MKKCGYMTFIFVLVAGAVCAAQSDQPTLGDLAKQQKHDKKVVKMLTNDDVATVKPDASVQSAKAEPASLGGTSSTAAAKAPEKVNDAKTAPVSKDTPEIAELKQKLNSYKAELDGWKHVAKKYEDLLANETDDFRRQMYQDALEGDKHNVELYQGKIDQTQEDLTKAEKASSPSH
jgi:hypothetical protein